MLEPAIASPPTLLIPPPKAGEYAPYYGKYIALVKGEDILAALEQQRRDTMKLLCGRDEQDGDFRYAPGKWSAKEVLGHVCDTERVFAYRALRISRGDATPMEGFEQDDYVRNGPFAGIPLSEIIEDYIAVRRATLTLLRNLDEAAWLRRGVANKNEVTVRALAYIIAGHELHHRAILEEKYFANCQTMSGTRALTELLRGKGAHVDPLACVEDLSAEAAVRRVDGFPHSIGGLVFHMNYWMDYDMRRIRGERPKYPESNSESFPSEPTPADEREWDRLREEFSTLLNAIAALANSSHEDLDREIEPTHPSHRERAASLEAMLWQLMAHNSYHVGQIAIIRRMLGMWPPRSGGDTW